MKLFLVLPDNAFFLPIKSYEPNINQLISPYIDGQSFTISDSFPKCTLNNNLINPSNILQYKKYAEQLSKMQRKRKFEEVTPVPNVQKRKRAKRTSSKSRRRKSFSQSGTRTPRKKRNVLRSGNLVTSTPTPERLTKKLSLRDIKAMPPLNFTDMKNEVTDAPLSPALPKETFPPFFQHHTQFNPVFIQDTAPNSFAYHGFAAQDLKLNLPPLLEHDIPIGADGDNLLASSNDILA